MDRQRLATKVGTAYGRGAATYLLSTCRIGRPRPGDLQRWSATARAPCKGRVPAGAAAHKRAASAAPVGRPPTGRSTTRNRSQERPPTGGITHRVGARRGAACGNDAYPQGQRAVPSLAEERRRRPLDEGKRG
ncbi:hypothetical protein GW17_00038346 [Ensete ventricosum]|nr:hypothetical protein GW17_00038346 [Ensete ventricosum]